MLPVAGGFSGPADELAARALGIDAQAPNAMFETSKLLRVSLIWFIYV